MAYAKFVRKRHPSIPRLPPSVSLPSSAAVTATPSSYGCHPARNTTPRNPVAASAGRNPTTNSPRFPAPATVGGSSAVTNRPPTSSMGPTTGVVRPTVPRSSAASQSPRGNYRPAALNCASGTCQQLPHLCQFLTTDDGGPPTVPTTIPNHRVVSPAAAVPAAYRAPVSSAYWANGLPPPPRYGNTGPSFVRAPPASSYGGAATTSVSYTHLTLPTKRIV